MRRRRLVFVLIIVIVAPVTTVVGILLRLDPTLGLLTIDVALEGGSCAASAGRREWTIRSGGAERPKVSLYALETNNRRRRKHFVLTNFGPLGHAMEDYGPPSGGGEGLSTVDRDLAMVF